VYISISSFFVFYQSPNTLLLGLGAGGNDTYVVDNSGDVVTETASNGTDVVIAFVTLTLPVNIEHLTLTGTTSIDGTGNSLSNRIGGNSGNNRLDGGIGKDWLIGGMGDDSYVVDRPDDVVSEGVGEGSDLVESCVTYTLGAALEELTLTGWAAINGTGNSLNNVMTGNSVANRLDGNIGSDSMAGGLGNDTYVVNGAGDQVTESASEGSDLVESSCTMTLPVNVENLLLWYGAKIDGAGNSLSNKISGNKEDNRLDGGGGSDSLLGGGGQDTYVVDDPSDLVLDYSRSDFDVLESSVTFTLPLCVERLLLTGNLPTNGFGNSFNNFITGNLGANLLAGGLGSDTMAGEAGDDSYVVNSAGDAVRESASEGIDLVNSSVTLTLTDNVENLTLTGSLEIKGYGNSLDNVIVGNVAANRLDGRSGRDTLTGGAGNDTYTVDSSDDVATESAMEGIDLVEASITWELVAEFENLSLTGSLEANATGNSLNNVIRGNTAPNRLDGGIGSDSLSGGDGADTYVVDSAEDLVTENSSEATDRVESSVSYTLPRNVEILTLTGSLAISGFGNSANNFINGNSLANRLGGGAGSDSLSGGSGDDTYVVDQSSDLVKEIGSGGNDLVESSVTFTLSANVENLTLTGSAAIDGFGSLFNNVIVGNAQANQLDGRRGSDSLLGGAGNDSYEVDNTDDLVEEGAFEGVDLVSSSVSLTLGAYVENLTLTGRDAINGTGNTLDNLLIGNSLSNTLQGSSGDDFLDGRAGVDSLAGGAGDDTYVVSNRMDVVSESPAQGSDQIQSTVSFTLGANLERLVLTGDSDIKGEGNTLDNQIVGNGEANWLDGGSGSDSLDGGLGNDVYIVDSAADRITESASAGTDRVQASVSFTLPGNVENLTLTGTGAIGATGNLQNNTLTGNSAVNQLDGTGAQPGTGQRDSLAGGLGADLFVLGNASERYYDDGRSDTSGRGDYAYLTDFSPRLGDKLQLKGAANQYFLGSNPLSEGSGQGIYFDSDDSRSLGRHDELIAVVATDRVINFASDAQFV
jgi:trimeric autotransporter adhesin